MNDDITYQPLAGEKLETIANCLNDAFSDYAIPVHVTADYLQSWFLRTNTHLALSFGAYHQGQLVGIVINGFGEYQGVQTAFDVVTGIVPQQRGRGVFDGLFSRVKAAFQAAGVRHYYLEVLQENAKAIHLYQKHSLEIVRGYVFYSGKSALQTRASVLDQDMSHFDFAQVELLYTFVPSFQQKTASLLKEAHRFGIAHTVRNGLISAFCLYDRKSGTVYQCGHRDNLQGLEDVILSINAQYPSLTFANIDEADEATTGLLQRLGFTVLTKQYEMTCTIT